MSFGMAQHRGGHCYLRFDDTNPEAEKQEYIDHIREIVRWMGWTPYKVGPALHPSSLVMGIAAPEVAAAAGMRAI